MRSLIFLLASALSFQISAQDRVSAANATAKALANAPIHQRDSLNKVLKRDLRSLLEQDDAPIISLSELQMSRVDAPDNSFRLITWNIVREDGSNQFEGMLLHIAGRKRAVYELRDMTQEITSPEVHELPPDRWYGALYYEVVPVKKGAKTYYTLLGWKGYDRVQTRKVIEVLHFKGGQPRFGAQIFGSGKLKKSRQVFGYSFQATMTLRYEPGTGIIMDHLAPTRADLEGQWAFYGPDMSYDAFVWEKDHWHLQRDIDARDRNKSTLPFKAPPPAPSP